MRQARIRQGRHELENLEPLETELIGKFMFNNKILSRGSVNT